MDLRKLNYWQLGRLVTMASKTIVRPRFMKMMEFVAIFPEEIGETVMLLAHSILEMSKKHNIEEVSHFASFTKDQISVLNALNRAALEGEETYLRRILKSKEAIRIRKKYLVAFVEIEPDCQKETLQQLKFFQAFTT